MAKGCQIPANGYTVYFAGERNGQSLITFLKGLPSDQWQAINYRMVWVIEPLFYHILDRLGSDMDGERILAVASHRNDPLQNLDQLKSVAQFRQELAADWIDRLIMDRSVLTMYQPIVSLQDKLINIIGYELLSRGIDESGNLIPPLKMFEAARVRNLVIALDRVCRLEAVKNASIIKNRLVFINFIPAAMHMPEHNLQSMFDFIEQSQLHPEQIVFEVVESDEIPNIEHLKSILQNYKAHGLRYALDDVGEGHTSLKLLSRLEPDYIKLAYEFSNGVSTDKGKQRIARSIVRLAHDMNSKALAEGIENEDDLYCLAEMGYDLFQGFYFAKPEAQPIDQILPPRV